MSKQLEDCNTQNFLEINVSDKYKPEMFYGRYHMVDNVPVLIDKNSDILGKDLKIRSPLYCIKPGKVFCEFCDPLNLLDL